jgi:hypothetical protein
MREDRVHQLFFRGFEPHGDDEALDQFRMAECDAQLSMT